MFNPVPRFKARPPYSSGIALIPLLASLCAACIGCAKPAPQRPAEGAPGLEYALVISPEDWGPAVKKIVVNAGTAIAPDKVGKDMFTVTLRAQAWDDKNRKAVVVERPRAVIDAYASDENGERSGVPGPYIALELPYHPADALSNPLFWDPADEYNKWKTPFAYAVASALLPAPATRLSGRICPQSDAFALDTFSSGEVKLSYAWFRPAAAGKRPLIVWLHGAGEGGTDSSVALLGNKVTSLASPEIQGFFGGAYVLVPQSPTVWMTQGGRRYDISEEARSSSYSPAVEALIRGFISANPNIDDRRVYLGGCSNGGYMTINLLLRNPGYFAAAFPVSEAFPDSWLGADDIARLSRERIWFIASSKDASVDPRQYAQATFARLREAGAADVRLSLFGAVTDMTGKYKDGDQAPYEYYGHWAWIRALNNECVDDGMSLMQWMASRSR
jgi:poly(3-hydroxybutyrate) depolymerase